MNTGEYDEIVSDFKKINCSTDCKKEIEIWCNLHFGSILSMPSGTKGALGKKLVTVFLEKEGCRVESVSGRSRDKLINDFRCQIKLSTLWEHGDYKFQQVKNTKCNFLLCLGISSNNIHFWYAKDNFWNQLPGQHTGERASETKTLTHPLTEAYKYKGFLFGGEFCNAIKLFLNEIKT